MQEVIFLIVFPLVIALALTAARRVSVCNALVALGAIGLGIGSVALLAMNFHHEIVYFKAGSALIDKAMLAVEVILGVYIVRQALRFKRPWALWLVIGQVGLTAGFEFACGNRLHAVSNIFIDKLSIIMTTVVGIIGSLICVYAMGYMKDFHRQFHRELPDNRRFFFLQMFVFLSAMFGIVFSNNLLWFCFFWEITTVCSFLLIGYKKNPEAVANAFRALEFNLFGGLLLIIAIGYLFFTTGSIELDALMTGNKAVVLLPIALISCAGLIKSAQFPFSSWLLGAMVAPTPVSALLHSSTMVKAGVYIILRFASQLEGTLPGLVLALIGGLTFLIASCIAISQSDAKKILAYSTIANLGLIVLCAGV
ncbi:MAG: proton-conducting transporter membrane subunit, partial [Candidatus Omnitrophica bacterium]|nr:proton-conducting transporter membrane subunit [Candidatus Omnitrophota bacterium]